MRKIISCCGVVCSDCESYPHECKSCHIIEGAVYWLEYVDETICPIYDCCIINIKQFEHCGQCSSLACEYYFRGDPTKTDNENKAILYNQIKQLKSM